MSQYVSRMAAIYHRNSRFRFHLSPPGNGLDCHRTWEALYLGVVPVIKSGPLDRLFDDTPAWIVHSWDELTEESMEARWQQTMQRWYGQQVERLHFHYWRKVVIGVARTEMEQSGLAMEASWMDENAPRQRCWGPTFQRADQLRRQTQQSGVQAA